MAAPKKNKKDVAVKKASVKKTSTKKKKVSKAKQQKAPKNKSVENNSSYALDAVLVINEVKVLHEELSKLSSSIDTVTIDASKVEMIDTAAFQLLVAFVSTMNKKDVKLVWENPSDVFIERASILNLIDALCLGKA